MVYLCASDEPGEVALEFRDEGLRRFWEGEGPCPRYVPPALRRQLARRLQHLGAATSLQDLRVPPGNRLERLSGDRSGQHSIRVNDQWRLCFTWSDGTAKEVEFCDYH